VRRRCLALLAVLCLLIPTPAGAGDRLAAAEGPAATVPLAPAARRYLVVLDPAAGPPAEQAMAHAGRLGVVPDQVYHAALDGYSASVPAGALAALLAEPGVRSVVPDRPVRAAGQATPTGVARVGGVPGAGRAGGRRGARVDADVAVLDSGIDPDHPDLHVAGGIDCTRGAGGVAGYGDGSGHGTHVAGTIGAVDDGRGVVGVAPGVRLWAVRVLDGQGQGLLSSVLCGIDWVTAHAEVIDVANLSLGAPGRRPAGAGARGCRTADPLHDAICRSVAAGITYTVAAGNAATDAGGIVPAAYDQVITVSALADFDGRPGRRGRPGCTDDQDDSFARFSNHGAAVDLIAPGTCIVSTWPGGGLATASGTSMAAPHAAGAAARHEAAHPADGPARVRAALLAAGGDDWDPRDDPDGRAEPLLHLPADGGVQR
jgi:subtilisin